MANFEKILKTINGALDKFDRQIPSIQKIMLKEINVQLQRLDINDDGSLKQSVANMKVLGSIKNKLNKIILNKKYLSSVKEFAEVFNTLSTLQTEYWSTVEADYKPKPLLREIRINSIQNTIQSLTESGIGTNISKPITQMLEANITTGGSMEKLRETLKQAVVGDSDTDGYLQRYSKQITTDSINQYNAQYTQAVAAGLDYEWYAYQGSDITTTREFCFALTDLRYFHISEIPRLLKAKDLFYKNEFTGAEGPVRINKKTNLPYGMIPGTNADNFFVNRGGYNCGHQIRPVSVDLVPKDRQEQVYASVEYKRWKQLTK
jgi:hypothetical protein